MNLNNKSAEIFVPDSKPAEYALNRTTHLSVGAHQDDLEIMAYHGISECFGAEDKWFTGVVVTNGSGSPRNGKYASFSDEEMIELRKQEQKKAAIIGEYSAVALLDYTSIQVKDNTLEDANRDLEMIIKASKPKVIYTHNLLDKHETHIAVAIRVINTLRELPDEYLPEKLYGCEVWRGLDWMNDEDKVILDVSSNLHVAYSLIEVFDSQICGGKRYDLATVGRRVTNATYSASHDTDKATAVNFAMDMTPLIKHKSRDIESFVLEYVDRFRDDVRGKIAKMIGT